MQFSKVLSCGLIASLFTGGADWASAQSSSQTRPIEVTSQLELTFGTDNSTMLATVTLKNMDLSRRVCVPWSYLLPGWQDGFEVKDARGSSLPQRGPDEFVDPKKYVVDFLIIPPDVSLSVGVPLSSLLRHMSADERYTITWRGTALDCPPPGRRITWHALSRMDLAHSQLQSDANFQISASK